LLQFILTAGITAALAVIAALLAAFTATPDLNWVRATYGLAAAGGDIFLLNHFINQLRQKAACVQEQFDCDVLNLHWNKVCCGEQPKPEDIKRYADKYLSRAKSYDKLQNWYAKTIAEVDGPAAKVICQRSNFAYDMAIRRSFLYWVVGICLVILTAILVIALIVNASGRSIAAMSIFPILPVLVFAGRLVKEHLASLKNLDSLNASIMSLWSEILIGPALDVERTIRQIQDKLYLNRRSSPLIPEWFYTWKRPCLEEQMYYGVDELVQQYRARAK
jgi:hypothetical protein